jgi:hypothetical protein
MIAAVRPHTMGGLAFGLGLAAVVVAVGFGLRRVLGPRRGHTALVTAVLIGFFAVWTMMLGDGRSGTGLALFVGAVVTFKVMNRFEPSASERNARAERGRRGPPWGR